MKRSTTISMLVVLMMLVGIAVVFLNSMGKPPNEVVYASNMDKMQIEYTPDELEELYSKYNITEIDIKFAKGELPHYLEGTILGGNTRVIVSSTGEPPEGAQEGVDYDVVINMSEMMAIEKEAIEKYIQKYGVDPGNPKLDDINGTLLPREEVNRLVKRGVLIPSE